MKAEHIIFFSFALEIVILLIRETTQKKNKVQKCIKYHRKKDDTMILCMFSQKQFMEKSGQISIMGLDEKVEELSLLTSTYSDIDDTSLLSSSLN